MCSSSLQACFSLAILMLLITSSESDCWAEDPDANGRLPSLQSQAIVPNLRRAATDVYCGGEPQGDAAFELLAELGVQTIVSVDGARPRVQAAKRHGLRYVHIPIGYDTISSHACASLARVVRECAQPIYVHCHHGRHRAPAAAAIACMVSGSHSVRDALELLEKAGTSRDYAGLWKAVAEYRNSAMTGGLPELLEVAPVSDLASVMSEVDRNMDRLELCRQAGWNPPPRQPDVEPIRLALLLREAFRELSRHSDDKAGELAGLLEQSARHAERLEIALRRTDHVVADRLLRGLRSRCAACHQTYRN